MAFILKQEHREIEISSVKPHPRNPRQGDIGAIHESIQENGFYGEILVQASTGFILAGNHRWKAAKEAKLDRIPACFVDVDDETALRILLVDNRMNDLASYNKAELAAILQEIEETCGSLVGTGYEGDDLDDLLSDLEGFDKPKVEEEQDEPPPPPKIAKSRPGDLYLLGKHRLIVGDSGDLGTVSRLMDGKKANLAITDPPYNVAYVGKTEDALTIENDDLPQEEFLAKVRAWFKSLEAALDKGSPFFIFAPPGDPETDFRIALRETSLLLKQVLPWVKEAFVMGRQDFHWQHEDVLYGWKEGAAHSWYGGRDKATILNFNRTPRNDVHPTMKPLDLLSYLLSLSSKKGDLVVDLFGGSGSTLIACEQSGRTAFLCELDPCYADVIVERWETLTGKKAELVRGEEEE